MVHREYQIGFWLNLVAWCADIFFLLSPIDPVPLQILSNENVMYEPTVLGATMTLENSDFTYVPTVSKKYYFFSSKIENPRFIENTRLLVNGVY